MLGLSQTIKSEGVTLDVTPFDGKAKDFHWMKSQVSAFAETY